MLKIVSLNMLPYFTYNCQPKSFTISLSLPAKNSPLNPNTRKWWTKVNGPADNSIKFIAATFIFYIK